MSTLDTLPAHVPVLVIGGGPVGLALGVELARQGVSALVVDKEIEIRPSPVKAMLLNPRTLEQFRRWGMAERLRAAATTPAAWQKDVVFATSLTGKELGVFREGFAFRATEQSDRVSESGQVVMQPDTTRVLREQLVDDGGRLALGWECVELSQDEDGCRALLVENTTGRTATVTAEYVVGCDGGPSLVRRTAGITRSGRGGLSANLLLHWRAPAILEDPAVTPAGFTGVYHPKGNALCVAIDDEHWCAHVAGQPLGVDIDQIDVEAIIAQICGPGVEFEVTFKGVYNIHERVADTYRAGRFFLAGDSAHLYAPFGGHNMNSGLGDAFNLGWKLAAALQGWGGEALLDSYEAERRPIAVRNAQEASANVARFVAAAKAVFADMDPATVDEPGFAGESRRRAWGDAIWAAVRPQFVSEGITIDQRFESAVVAPDDEPATPWDSTAYSWTSRAGHRAPHAWLSPGVSLHDVLGATGLSLLHRPEDAEAAAGFATAAAALSIPLTLVPIDGELLRARYPRAFTLVRPDLQVAWRGDDPADAPGALSLVTGRAAVLS